MTIHTDYEDYSLNELIQEFSSLEQRKAEQGNAIFKLIDSGIPGEDPAVKKFGEIHKSLTDDQFKVAYEFIRRFTK